MTQRKMPILCAVAVLGLPFWIAATPSASAFDNDRTGAEGLLDAAIGILGFGARKEREPIDYSPRSPLVIPPSMDLPAPRAAARENENWPNDPDALARAKREAERNKTVYERNPQDQKTRRLSPEELQAGRTPGGGLLDWDSPPASKPADDRASRRLSPTELSGFSRKLDPTPEFDADGQPIRRRLVEPPSSYRVPASTAEYDPRAQDDRKPASELGRDNRFPRQQR